MTSSAKVLLSLGTLLTLLSFGVNMMIAGAEGQAREFGEQKLSALNAQTRSEAVHRVFQNQLPEELSNSEDLAKKGHQRFPLVGDVREANEVLKKYKLLLVDSAPPMAEIVHQGASVPFQRTPALVPTEKGTYTLRTRFREKQFEESELAAESVSIPLTPFWLFLRYLFLPGLLCLGIGLKAFKASPPRRPSTVKDRSSSLDTVLRTAPPLPPQGLYEHDPATAEEDIFGRFVRGVEIGRGSMGQVYTCTSCLPGDTTTYALKVLLPEWSAADDFRARFEREADVCRKFNHPNLVRAYDHGEKDGRLYMVMDYVEGEELEAWMTSKKHSEDELIKMFASIFQGLEYAHKVGVLHRDLKPSNILVTRDSQRPVIADFGLARGKHYATITKTNTTLGTPAYIAPEQITGGKGSPESDLYSLGCVMYEAVAGVPPFEEKDVMKLLTMKLMADTPPNLPDDAAGDKLRAIVTKLLAHRVEDRFRSATEVLEALSA